MRDNRSPLLGARADSVPAGAVIPPNVRRVPCSGCGVVLLLSDSSRELIRQGIARPVCKACLPSRALIPVMTTDAVKELRGFIRDDAARNRR